MPLQLSGSIAVSGSLIVSGSVTTTGAITTTLFSDMSFQHTSGSTSDFAGVGIPITASNFGGGVDGAGHILLYPTASAPNPQYVAFRSENRNCKLVSYRMYTNITGSDFPQYDYNSQGPKISTIGVATAKLTDVNSFVGGQTISNSVFSLTSGSYDRADGTWSLISSGAYLSGPTTEIGDAGTLYISANAPFPISLSPAYSPTYYTFLMNIGAAFATKVYKFRFELDIQNT